MKKRRNGLRIIILSMLGTTLAIAGIATWLAVPLVPTTLVSRPSDSQMIKSFQAYREQYNQLLQMFQTDKRLESVGEQDSDWSPSPESASIDNARLQKYKALLAQLHVLSLVRSGAPHGFEFMTYVAGLLNHGYYKGYFYLEKPPSPLVGDTAAPNAPVGDSYRHLEGNWYIWYEDF